MKPEILYQEPQRTALGAFLEFLHFQRQAGVLPDLDHRIPLSFLGLGMVSRKLGLSDYKSMVAMHFPRFKLIIYRRSIRPAGATPANRLTECVLLETTPECVWAQGLPSLRGNFS
jgi:hypothetical protein